MYNNQGVLNQLWQSINSWTSKKPVYVHNRVLFSHEEGNYVENNFLKDQEEEEELYKLHGRWMESESIMVREINWIQKDKYCVLLHSRVLYFFILFFN